jgi:hypothetical protein
MSSIHHDRPDGGTQGRADAGGSQPAPEYDGPSISESTPEEVEAAAAAERARETDHVRDDDDPKFEEHHWGGGSEPVWRGEPEPEIEAADKPSPADLTGAATDSVAQHGSPMPADSHVAQAGTADSGSAIGDPDPSFTFDPTSDPSGGADSQSHGHETGDDGSGEDEWLGPDPSGGFDDGAADFGD